MADQAEPPEAAAEARRSELSQWQDTAASADRELTEALRHAHAAAVTGRARVDAIAAEIERAVADQDVFAVDTPLGGHEFQRLLVTKNRQLASVVAEVDDDAAARRAALAALHSRYRQAPGEPG